MEDDVLDGTTMSDGENEDDGGDEDDEDVTLLRGTNAVISSSDTEEISQSLSTA